MPEILNERHRICTSRLLEQYNDGGELPPYPYYWKPYLRLLMPP